VLPVNDFHNGVTAGYFVKFAQSAEGQKYKTATFDPVSYSLGYGSHMMADKVGFYTQGKGGFLGPTVPNYVTFFPFMTAIDALVITRDSFPASVNWTSDEAIQYLSAATKYYNSVSNGKFAFYNTSDVTDCLIPWADTDEQLLQLAELQMSTGYYKAALLTYDKYGATTFEQVVQHFELSLGCVVSAIQYWATAALGATTPEDAYTQTLTHITNMYNAGKCAPL
jgi:hypothetical protein